MNQLQLANGKSVGEDKKSMTRDLCRIVPLMEGAHGCVNTYCMPKGKMIEVIAQDQVYRITDKGVERSGEIKESGKWVWKHSFSIRGIGHIGTSNLTDSRMATIKRLEKQSREGIPLERLRQLETKMRSDI